MPWWMKHRLRAEGDNEGGAAGSGDAGAGGSGDAGGEGGGGDPNQPPAAGSGQAGGLLAQHARREAGEGDPPGGEGEGGEVSDPNDGRPTYKLDDGTEKPLPDQFWDAEKGQVRVDALAKAHDDNKAAFRRTQQQLLEAQKGQGTGETPEKPEDYAFEAPEGVSRDVAEDDVLLQNFRNVAHQHGLTQEQFKGVTADMLKQLDEQLGPPTDPEAEKAKLGENADEMISGVYRWAQSLQDQGQLSQDEFQEIVSIGDTAVGISALAKLRAAAGEKPLPTAASNVSSLPSKEELYRKVADPRYGSDPAFRQQVDQEFEQVFGTDPAGSSPQGMGVGTGRR